MRPRPETGIDRIMDVCFHASPRDIAESSAAMYLGSVTAADAYYICTEPRRGAIVVHRRPLIGTPNAGSGSGRDRRAAFLVELNADMIPGQRFLIRHSTSVVAALLIYCMLTLNMADSIVDATPHRDGLLGDDTRHRDLAVT
jgi:hypothetical protein